jgi:pimeloyl-ACP methyl ester carboxylesterase
VKIMLLHAFPLDERMWEPQRAALERREVFAPRLYGRGSTMDAWAASVVGETDGELVVVGVSMGGYCALALARRVPERVRGLFLIGSRPDPDSEERRAGRADTIDLIRNEGVDALWEMMVPKLFADPGKADRRLLHRDADELVEAVEAIRDRKDNSDTARALGDRLQFVVGEADPFVSAEDLSGFNVRQLAGAGHLANIERPGEVNRLLRDFLDRV